MVKSALGVVFSLFAFAVAAPVTQAATTAPSKATSKKQTKGSTSSAAKTLEKSTLEKSKRVAQASSRKNQVARRAPSRAVTKAAIAKQSKNQAVVASIKPKQAVQPVSYAPPAPAVAPVMTAGDMAGLHMTRDPLALKSNAAFVIDQTNAQVLFDKNSSIPLPIASLTKLMTALIVVEARQNMDEVLQVTSDDIDREKNSSSRLRVGTYLTRAQMLHIALMSSENRAASALGRHYPGGFPAFVAAMNAKARALGMIDAHFVDSTGLSSQNVASARDLAKLVVAAYKHPIIREYSTHPKHAVDVGGYQLHYMNSNRLVMNPDWEIGLQKTGYIAEAGRCLVMQAMVDGRPVVMVFLDSKGKDSRLADASRVRKWLEISKPQNLTQAAARQS